MKPRKREKVQRSLKNLTQSRRDAKREREEEKGIKSLSPSLSSPLSSFAPLRLCVR
jgi:hypothetical protein